MIPYKFIRILLLILNYVYRYGFNHILSSLITSIPFCILFFIVQNLLYNVMISNNDNKKVNIVKMKVDGEIVNYGKYVKHNAFETNLGTLIMSPLLIISTLINNIYILPSTLINYGLSYLLNYDTHYVYYHMYTPTIVILMLNELSNGNMFGPILMLGCTAYEVCHESQYFLYDNTENYDKDNNDDNEDNKDNDKDNNKIDTNTLLINPLLYSIIFSTEYNEYVYSLLGGVIALEYLYRQYLRNGKYYNTDTIRSIIEKHCLFVSKMNVKYIDNYIDIDLQYIKSLLFNIVYYPLILLECFILGEHNDTFSDTIRILMVSVALIGEIIKNTDMIIILWFALWIVSETYLISNKIKRIIKEIPYVNFEKKE